MAVGYEVVAALLKLNCGEDVRFLPTAIRLHLLDR